MARRHAAPMLRKRCAVLHGQQRLQYDQPLEVLLRRVPVLSRHQLGVCCCDVGRGRICCAWGPEMGLAKWVVWRVVTVVISLAPWLLARSVCMSERFPDKRGWYWCVVGLLSSAPVKWGGSGKSPASGAVPISWSVVSGGVAYDGRGAGQWSGGRAGAVTGARHCDLIAAAGVDIVGYGAGVWCVGFLQWLHVCSRW